MTVIVKEKATFVDFMCTDVSSLFPHLVMFMPTKEIVSCSAISIVKFKF